MVQMMMSYVQILSTTLHFHPACCRSVSWWTRLYIHLPNTSTVSGILLLISVLPNFFFAGWKVFASDINRPISICLFFSSIS